MLLLDARGEICCPTAAGSHCPLWTPREAVWTQKREEGQNGVGGRAGRARGPGLHAPVVRLSREFVTAPRERPVTGWGWLPPLFPTATTSTVWFAEPARAAAPITAIWPWAGTMEGTGLRPVGQWPARGGRPCSGVAALTLASSAQRAGLPSCGWDQAAPPSARCEQEAHCPPCSWRPCDGHEGSDLGLMLITLVAGQRERKVPGLDLDNWPGQRAILSPDPLPPEIRRFIHVLTCSSSSFCY